MSPSALPPVASQSEFQRALKSGTKQPDPNAAGSTRDAAKAAIDMFRNRDK